MFQIRKGVIIKSLSYSYLKGGDSNSYKYTKSLVLKQECKSKETAFFLMHLKAYGRLEEEKSKTTSTATTITMKKSPKKHHNKTPQLTRQVLKIS